jgi:hypothetical protein
MPPVLVLMHIFAYKKIRRKEKLGPVHPAHLPCPGAAMPDDEGHPHRFYTVTNAPRLNIRPAE